MTFSLTIPEGATFSKPVEVSFVTSGGVREGGWVILEFNPAAGVIWLPIGLAVLCVAGPLAGVIDFAVPGPPGAVLFCVDAPLVNGVDLDGAEISAVGVADLGVSGPFDGVAGVWVFVPPEPPVRAPVSPGTGRFTCGLAGPFFCLSCGLSSP